MVRRERALIASIQVGQPRELGVEGATGFFQRPWTTGIFKEPVAGDVWLSKHGVAGDGQADLTVHGGPDKAVCSYGGDHYTEWRRSPELASMGPGSFGENFTIEGLVEGAVCIGDIWSAGDAVLQVSQPRQPCWKLARKWGIKDFADRVIKSDHTGWYFRVLNEGWVSSGVPLVLRERSTAEWTVTAANRIMHGRPFDRDGSRRLAAVAALSASWQATLSRR